MSTHGGTALARALLGGTAEPAKDS
jgi:hypothetical protein